MRRKGRKSEGVPEYLPYGYPHSLTISSEVLLYFGDEFSKCVYIVIWWALVAHSDINVNPLLVFCSLCNWGIKERET